MVSLPKIIITADDYGMSPRFNAGILELAREGIVTSISVMIGRKYIRKADLLTLDVALGLHLEIKSVSSYREVISQIKRFAKRFGRLPAYLDGHQHQHITPGNISHVIRAAKRFSLPVRSRYPADRVLLKSAGVSTPDQFVSWHPERLSVLKKRLREAQSSPVSELVTHPGYADKDCRYPYNVERSQELNFLKSARFRKMLLDFSAINYSSLGFPK